MYQIGDVYARSSRGPKQRAFYYVRVLEIPKLRWTAYDAKFFGIEMPDDTLMTIQDRAYTSPIRYTP